MPVVGLFKPSSPLTAHLFVMPTMSFILVANGLVASGSVASGLAASGSVVSSLVVLGFSGCLFHGFLVAGFAGGSLLCGGFGGSRF